jgi:hypothetical protein
MHNAGMIYGYARVSTRAQDLTSQFAELKAAGCEKVFREKITGTTAERPQLRKLMAALAPGEAPACGGCGLDGASPAAARSTNRSMNNCPSRSTPPGVLCDISIGEKLRLFYR